MFEEEGGRGVSEIWVERIGGEGGGGGGGGGSEIGGLK